MTLSYQWERCNSSGQACSDIAAATASTYLVVNADIGSTIRCRVTDGVHTQTSPPTLVVQAVPPVPATGAYFGTRAKPLVGGQTQIQAIAAFETLVGRTMAIDHYFVLGAGSLPTPEMTSSAANGRFPLIDWDLTDWANIANGVDDAALTTSANAVKAWGQPCFINFDHEPEGETVPGDNQSSFKAAWQHIVNLFNAQGVANVAWVWILEGETFTSPSAADAWYPGDAYVDWISADAYNWYPGRSGSAWREFSTVMQPFRTWAAGHQSKPVMIGETGCQEDPSNSTRKAQWYTNLLQTMKGWPQAKAFVYFNSDQIYPWMVNTSASSLSAFQAIGADPWFNP